MLPHLLTEHWVHLRHFPTMAKLFCISSQITPTVGSSRIMRSGPCKRETAKLTRRCWPPLRVPTVREEGGRSSKPVRNSSCSRTYKVFSLKFQFLPKFKGSHLLASQAMQSTKVLKGLQNGELATKIHYQINFRHKGRHHFKKRLSAPTNRRHLSLSIPVEGNFLGHIT